MRGLKPMHQMQPLKHPVASFTDAWIETMSISVKLSRLEVASFTDAWIETSVGTGLNDTDRSHLLQMRGLKQIYMYLFGGKYLSHLLQMRGLKHKHLF